MRHYFLILITSLIIGCDKPKGKTLENDFLSSELKKLQHDFFKKVKSDYPRYLPSKDRLLYLDAPFKSLISNIESINNKDSLLIELEKCKEVLINITGPLQKTRESCVKEMDFLIENNVTLNSTEIKQRLELIQYIFWSAYDKYEINLLFTVDKIGIFISDTVGKQGNIFSTLIVPVARNTTFEYDVWTGDSISKETGKLLGKINELKINKEHNPIFETKNYKKGKNRVPAQFVAKYTNGRVDTINFNIDFKIE